MLQQRNFCRDKCFYVTKNISENGKIKAGNMSRHFQGMSRHKVRSQHSKASKLCRDIEVLCSDNHNKMLRELCRDIGFYCHDKD